MLSHSLPASQGRLADTVTVTEELSKWGSRKSVMNAAKECSQHDHLNIPLTPPLRDRM